MTGLETERLLLRPIDMSDIDNLQLLYADAELMRYITGYACTREETEARIAMQLDGWRKYGFGLYATLLKETNEWIGRCGVEPRETPSGLEGELAWLLRREYRGAGYATEVGAALIDVGLRECGLVRMYATALVENEPSIAVMKRLGMSFVRSFDGQVEYEVRHLTQGQPQETE